MQIRLKIAENNQLKATSLNEWGDILFIANVTPVLKRYKMTSYNCSKKTQLFEKHEFDGLGLTYMHPLSSLLGGNFSFSPN